MDRSLPAWWASSPCCPTRGRRRAPSSSPDCPGRASRPVRGRRRPPGPIRTCRAGSRDGTDRHDRRGRDATEIPPPAAPPYGVTGNWFGARDALFDEGIDLRTNLSQFYQGVTSGGLRQTFPYGLKFDYFGTIEAEKLFGWEGLFINLHGESRFGQSVNRVRRLLGPRQLRPGVPQAEREAPRP